MAIENMRIYKIDHGPAKELFEKQLRETKERLKKIDDFTKELGAIECNVYDDGRIACFEFADGQAPEGWKQHPSGMGHTPKRNTKAGKELAEQIERFGEHPKKAEDYFEGEAWVFFGTHMYTPSMGCVPGHPDTVVVTIHEDSKATPIEGLVEIKPSEFYALQGK